MKQFKKRTIALVLASVITVVGAFGAENFTNSLMSLKFTSGSGDSVNMTLYTKVRYQQTINPIRRDANTYVIMLPETGSQMPSSPRIDSNSIQSVNVVTMPYTTSSKGYTKITVKTYGNTTLVPQNELFLGQVQEPINNQNTPQTTATQTSNQLTQSRTSTERKKTQTNSQQRNSGTTRPYSNASSKNTYNRPVQTQTAVKKEPEPVQTAEPAKKMDYDSSESSPTEKKIILAGFILISIMVVFFYFQSKEKMASIVGEKIDLDFKSDEEEKKKSKRIRSTINKLDRKYNRPQYPKNNVIASAAIQSQKEQIFEPKEQKQEVEENNILDLDVLLKNAQESKTADNKEDTKEEATDNVIENTDNNEDYDDLAEFLNEFSFEDELQEEVNEDGFDEEFLNACLNNENLKFSKNDIEKINQLMQIEISEDTLEHLEEFARIAEEKPQSKLEKFENILSAYSINQNIEFSSEDVNALSKLMNVELDENFVKDLRTNPERTKTMLKELEETKPKPHKTSEILTLSVKDMLPDLSKELKKQGNKRIESNAKPEVIYFSEGYEVSKFSVSDDLSDIASALKDKKANEYRPSDDIDIIAPGYEVATLSIKDELPDLKDVKAHPNKYKEQKAKPKKADEKTLLQNLSNVTFKPFYEEENIPTMSDVQKEFSQFDNFEIINDDSNNIEKEAEPNDANDFAELFENEAQNEISLESITEEPEQNKKEEKLPVLKRVKREIVSKHADKNAEALLKLIEEQQTEREHKKQEAGVNKAGVNEVDNARKAREIKKPDTVEIPKTVTLENIEYSVIDHAKFDMRTGCYLCKYENKYTIIGYYNDNLYKLKEYDTLRTETLQARQNEKNNEGFANYIVRVSIHKFVVNITKDKMEFILDLC